MFERSKNSRHTCSEQVEVSTGENTGTAGVCRAVVLSTGHDAAPALGVAAPLANVPAAVWPELRAALTVPRAMLPGFPQCPCPQLLREVGDQASVYETKQGNKSAEYERGGSHFKNTENTVAQDYATNEISRWYAHYDVPALPGRHLL